MAEKPIIEFNVNKELHPHNLCIYKEKIEWYCDSITFNGICHGNQTRIMDDWPGNKFMCVEGCASLFCDKCVAKHQIAFK